MTAPRRRLRAPEILHLDADLLVVDKPPGVLPTPQRGEGIGLPNLLRERAELAEDEPFRIVHRLSEQTSGVVVYARTAAAQCDLTAQFRAGRAEVIYLALVSGYVERDREIDLPLYYDKRTGKLRTSERRGTPAMTHCRIVERLAGNTLLECRALNERADQVRVHLSAIGHPLTVDPAFGSGSAVLLSDYKPGYRPSGRRTERPLIERLTLHAATVSLAHPADGKSMQFAAPLPKDLRATFAQLRRWS